MLFHKNKSILTATTALVSASFLLATSPVMANSVSLNYDSLASLEEPLATEIGDVTLSLTGLLDMPLTLDFEDDDDFDVGFLGNFQVSAETQLSNRWTVGAAYFGQYETDQGSFDAGYTDNVAGYVGGVWGTLLGGNVNGVVREETRRLRGAGNGALAFDDMLGGFDDYGGAYVGRYGPAIASAVVDEDGNFDLGASWSRPIGNKDYRFTARYTNAEFLSADATTRFDTHGVGLVGEFIYGSSLFDLGLGYEDLSSAAVDADRWFASAGARHKVGALTLSLEGHYGDVEGDSEVSVAFGAQYDIARGLSVNLGVNHSDALLTTGGVTLVSEKETKGILSLRYSF